MRAQLLEHLTVIAVATACAVATGWWVRSFWSDPEVPERPLLADLAQEAAIKQREAEDARKARSQASAVPSGPSVVPQSASSPSAASVREWPGTWPGFRGPRRDGVCRDRAPLAESWPTGGPPVVWRLSLGEGYASAAIHRGRVFVLDYDREARADVLRCFSLLDAREIWRNAYPVVVKRNHGMSRTVPATDGRYVVSLGPKCHVLCADFETGRTLWRKDLVEEYGAEVPEWYAGQCPLIDGDRAILAPGGKALMVAIDLASGKEVWRTPNPQGWKMTHSSIVKAAVAGEEMYVYCASGGVVGVRAKDGSLLWMDPTWVINTATVPTPVPIGDGRFFLTGGYNAGAMMLRVERQDGAWRTRTLFRLPPSEFGSDQQTPVLYEGHLYGVAPGGQMKCLDLNGKVLWASGSQRRFGLGAYAVADGKIFALNDRGELTMLEASPKGYRELATARVLQGPDAWGPMAFASGLLVTRDQNEMVCLNLSGS
ncbi:MAG: PQQ-like beta-propeller repeat protein [Fimbriimonadales bacterium]|nr:PQQ-like beta-propeller repeat protein [Fimbriimonadales bacterium]